MKRLGKILWTDYKFYLLFVAVGIIGSVVATVTGTVFIKTLIDSYIMPMLSVGGDDFTALFAALTKLAIIFGIGVGCIHI